MYYQSLWIVDSLSDYVILITLLLSYLCLDGLGLGDLVGHLNLSCEVMFMFVVCTIKYITIFKVYQKHGVKLWAIVSVYGYIVFNSR